MWSMKQANQRSAIQLFNNIPNHSSVAAGVLENKMFYRDKIKGYMYKN